MKTSLLFILALIVGFAVSAQQSAFNEKAYERAQAVLHKSYIEKESPITQSISKPMPILKSTKDVSRVLMASSLNFFSVTSSSQTCMYYNKELDAIMGTFRGNQNGIINPFGTGNDICTHWSTDGGETFTHKIAAPSTDPKFHRYPSGAIYNLPGNTDLNQAFSVVGGPVAIGTAFDMYYLSSIMYDGSNFDVRYFPTINGFMMENGLMTTSNGYAHMCSIVTTDDGTNYTSAKPYIVNGKFNANTYAFDWDTLTVPTQFWTNPSGVQEISNFVNMAWNKDGSIGYLLTKGVDPRATLPNINYYPILHKSTDNGKTWQLMDYFDFSTIPAIQGKLKTLKANPAVTVPYFSDMDLAVDANGEPHVFAVCKGAYTEQQVDSIGTTYNHDQGAVFEFYHDGTTWKGNFIYKLKSYPVTYAQTPDANGSNEWTHRIQASRTDDGKKVFAAWTDTDWIFFAQSDSTNFNPDLFIWGRDVTSNKHTLVKNVTELTDAYGMCWFMFASPITRDINGVYEVPVSVSDINAYSPPNGSAEMYHYYLKGASLTEADFNLVGVDKGTKAEGIAASVYPNPFRGEANVSVSLDKPANVTIVITSIAGKQVKSMNYGNLTGKQNLKLDGSNLPSGVYFCTITAGDKKVTNKLVIK